MLKELPEPLPDGRKIQLALAIAVSKFSELEFRMTELEEELRDRVDGPNVPGWR